MLRGAVKNGHVEVLKWLHETYRLTASDARANENHALREAAENGHVEVLKWLHDTFELAVEDVNAVDDFIIIMR